MVPTRLYDFQSLALDSFFFNFIPYALLCSLVGEELRLPVSSKDYLSKLVEYGIMKLCASATVKETNQTWIEEDDFQVLMPSVDIKVAIHLNDVI